MLPKSPHHILFIAMYDSLMRCFQTTWHFTLQHSSQCILSCATGRNTNLASPWTETRVREQETMDGQEPETQTHTNTASHVTITNCNAKRRIICEVHILNSESQKRKFGTLECIRVPRLIWGQCHSSGG